jgi:hypothetical protein
MEFFLFGAAFRGGGNTDEATLYIHTETGREVLFRALIAAIEGVFWESTSELSSLFLLFFLSDSVRGEHGEHSGSIEGRAIVRSSARATARLQ